MGSGKVEKLGNKKKSDGKWVIAAIYFRGQVDPKSRPSIITYQKMEDYARGIIKI
jgi:hypothetical protein